MSLKRESSRRIAASLLVLACAAAAGAARPDQRTEAQRESGRKLYAKFCSQCHGDKGDGQGPATAHLLPLPRDFTKGAYKIRTTPSGALPTHQDLVDIIRRGMPGTAMPAWPQFSDDEVDELAHYLKTFSPSFAKPELNKDPIELPDAPEWTEESAKAGRKVYENIGCIKCHGNLGRGDGESAPTLTDDRGDPIRAADLTMRWTFRGGPTREDVFRTFSTGVNGTPMPSFADSLGTEERWQLVDYIASLGEHDEPRYSNLLLAKRIPDEIDLTRGAASFQAATPARFPIVGQIMEPGRLFFPAASSIMARAVYNDREIAVLLTWHDMRAEKTGVNGPALPVGLADEVPAPALAPAQGGAGGDDFWGEEAAPPIADTAAPAAGGEDDDFWGENTGAAAAATPGGAPGSQFSDAVAIQFPSAIPTGIRKPYFIFGDAQASVDLWFFDLAKAAPERFTGQGSASIVGAPPDGLEGVASFADGEWTVAFKRKLRSQSGIAFEPDQFVPIAYSLWDGGSRERGNRRGLTTWWSVYLEPAQEETSTAGPVVKTVLAALGIEVLLVALIRRKHVRQGERSS